MKRIIFLIIFFCSNSFALSMEDARQQAISFGGSFKNSASSTVSEQNKVATLGYTTDNPEQTKYFDGGNTAEAAQDKVKNSEEGKLMSQSLPNRPQITVSHSDSFLNQSKAIENNPDEIVAMLTGTYGECKPITKISTDSEIRTCDEYQQRSGGSCIVSQDVVVDAQHKYSCTKERNYSDKSCDKNLNLVCQNFGTCTSDGGSAIVTGEDTAYSYPYIDTNISWRGGSCSLYTRIMNINVKDISLIDSFILFSVGWDDSVEIKINGTSIFKDWQTFRGCERGRVFGSSPNVNLKPYLVQGNNIIELKLLVSGMGFASAHYSLVQKCCNQWQESWEEICSN